ncbi:MAG TPA: assimilatory sulfite reductase (NADPH) flavoprotein subunit [Rhodanobacteraceae bacterium]|nr:assimilatory sulfite reductase (NADPH) flavoprotein subunit [Rhodanobacteraceae bacterium]
MSAEPARLLSPLSLEKSAQLTRLVDGLDADVLYWLSGYLAAVGAQRRAGSASPPVAAPAAAAAPQASVTILYGSQTGNAKRVAEGLAREAEAGGLAVRLVRADAYPLRELAGERLLYVVISTQGEGDPPDDARGFVEFLASRRAPKLPQLRYAVLGLGDSSYPQFCAIGNAIDTRLAELGASRVLARGEADVDLDAVAKPWSESALRHAREILKSTPVAAKVTPLRVPAAAGAWHRARPFAAPVLANQRITARDGGRDVRHIELSLEGSGLAYEPGDSLGVCATNAPALVEAIVAALGEKPDRGIAIGGDEHAFATWLGEKRELTRLTRPFLVAHAERARADALDRALKPGGEDALRRILSDYQLVDLLREFPAPWDANELVAALRPLAPRLYSIASSRKAVGDEAHLAVALVAYEAFGSAHRGAASAFLSPKGDADHVPVFIEPNDRFRLPADPARDIVMIGPGTGVAPFRAFLQERAETGARGRNWLFFGNPHFRSDFLYQVEWQQALKQQTLHRLDLAFSRDQSEKVYVQHAIRRAGRELFAWIENGAHVYVCGDATRMAKDVDAALAELFVTHGGLEREDAAAALARMAQARRYARDVY